MPLTRKDVERLKKISAITPGDWNCSEAFGYLPVLLDRLSALEHVREVADKAAHDEYDCGDVDGCQCWHQPLLDALSQCPALEEGK